MLVRDLLRKLPPASAQLPAVPHTVNDVVWILARGPYLREKCRCCAGSGMVVGKDDRPYVCGPCNGDGVQRSVTFLPKEVLITRVEVSAGVLNAPESPQITYTVVFVDAEVQPPSWDSFLPKDWKERTALNDSECYRILSSTDARVTSEVFASEDLAEYVAAQHLLEGHANMLRHGLATPDGERHIVLTREWQLCGPVLEEGVWVWGPALPDKMPAGSVGVPAGENYRFVEPHAGGYRTFVVGGPGGAIPVYDKKHFAGSHFEHLDADDPRITAAHLALLG